MNWRQVEVFTARQGIDPLCAALEEIGVGGFIIRDAADFEQFLAGRQGRWDYVDESLMSLREEETTVTFYLPEGERGQAQLAEAEAILTRLKALDEQGRWGRLEAALSTVEEESWQDSWKRHWKPERVGKGLVVCPSWEAYTPAPGQTVIRLDPGMAFGTGGHDSTRLCMELAEGLVKGGERVLDLGSGSGILAVTALLLGAEEALGVDVDEVAVRVAGENAALNGVGAAASFRRGDLAAGVEGRYHLIFANIVADIILRLIPDLPACWPPAGR